MTELREPPVLSPEDRNRAYFRANDIFNADLKDDILRFNCLAEYIAFEVAKDQWEADKKWMKQHCYLKAEGELFEQLRREFFELLEDFDAKRVALFQSSEEWHKKADKSRDLGLVFLREIIKEMLKEVNGVAYRASKEFKD